MDLDGATEESGSGNRVVKELAVSILYPDPSGREPGSKSVCVIGGRLCVIGGRLCVDDEVNKGEEEEEPSEKQVMKRARRSEEDSDGGVSVQLFFADGFIMTEDDQKRCLQGVASESECEIIDGNGIPTTYQPFTEVRMDVEGGSTFVVAPNDHQNSRTIYCLGGSHCPTASSFSRDVRIFRFPVEDDESKFYSYGGPRMNIARSNPAAVSVEGTIYVFGGQHPSDQHSSRKDLWAESLDTTNPTSPWKFLAPPPTTPLVTTSRAVFAVAVDDGEDIFFKADDDHHHTVYGNPSGGKAILLGSISDGVFLAYHIREDRWVRLEDYSYSFLSELLYESSGGSLPVAVGPTLAWVGRRFFFVYDLRHQTSCAGHVRGLGYSIQHLLQNMDSAPYKPALHYLEGDIFCLTWFDWPSKFTRLHSTMIRVPLNNNPPSPFLPGYRALDPFVVSSRSYLLPFGFNYQCSLLLDGFVCCHKLVKEGVAYDSPITSLDEPMNRQVDGVP